MIRVEAVEKRYRRNVVLNKLSWVLPPGRTVLLGPNGAGKSTLMNCIAGIVHPQKGQVFIGDVPISRPKAYFPLLGWMPQHVHALPGRSCLTHVAYAGWLKGMSRNDAKESATALIEKVGLSEKIHDRANELSGGQLRRLGLAESLMGRPKVLVLDEPSVGLDPSQRQRFRNILTSFTGVDCLVSTHQVDDIDAVFDNVVVMRSGEIVHQSSVTEFLALAPSGLDTLNAAEFSYRKFVPDEL